ncbi:MAG: hypothetical protein E6772_12345 [Dysgonomonas sp.]|nr:hypothetical protein [Dysgonomonas sp.]
MIKFDFTGIKNTFMSNTLLSFNLNFFAKNKEIEQIEEDVTNVDDRKEFKDIKTLLGGSHSRLIEKINDDIITYLFIEKDKKGSEWNSVVPVIIEKSTNKTTQFGIGYFALEGSGSGLSHMDSLIYYLKKHIDRGYQVYILPKIVDNELLNYYQYFDSNIRLSTLIENSIDLINYQKDSFKWIYRQYQELLRKHMISSL